MRELTTVSTFIVTGRGTAHVVECGEVAPELHEHVKLDGEPCEVLGVELPIHNGHSAIIIRRLIGGHGYSLSKGVLE